ncbi:MAG: glycine cleavage system protein GcvH [archaeon]
MKYYTKNHEWFDSETCKVGITKNAQSKLGDIVFIKLPDIGNYYNQNDSTVVLKSIKSVFNVYTPVSCSIINVNYLLEDEPSLINKDPEGEGWIFKVNFDDSIEFDYLMSEEEYKEFVHD